MRLSLLRLETVISAPGKMHNHALHIEPQLHGSGVWPSPLLSSIAAQMPLKNKVRLTEQRKRGRVVLVACKWGCLLPHVESFKNGTFPNRIVPWLCPGAFKSTNSSVLIHTERIDRISTTTRAVEQRASTGADAQIYKKTSCMQFQINSNCVFMIYVSHGPLRLARLLLYSTLSPSTLVP